MPFRVAGDDSAYGWLRDGMAELLTARLSGEGGMRVADPGRVLRAWNREIAETAGARRTRPTCRNQRQRDANH